MGAKILSTAAANSMSPNWKKVKPPQVGQIHSTLARSLVLKCPVRSFDSFAIVYIDLTIQPPSFGKYNLAMGRSVVLR
jgi:hypothetical protein